MPKRFKDSGFWSDSFVQKLSAEGKLLFDYTWTNDHCKPSGLYHITLYTMSFETGIEESRLPELLETLRPKVEWYPEVEFIWVRNFVKRQAQNESFLRAVAKSLQEIPHAELVDALLEYNHDKYGIDIMAPQAEERKAGKDPASDKTKDPERFIKGGRGVTKRSMKD